MAVAWFKNPVLEEGAELIDRDSMSFDDENRFGRTKAKRHPAYVYSINKNAALMHKVAEVTIWHYAIVGGRKIGRLKQPAMSATTACGYHFSLTADRSRTCHVPEPGAVLCGRCHGQHATFKGRARRTPDGRTKVEARVALGCIVNGYPSVLERESR